MNLLLVHTADDCSDCPTFQTVVTVCQTSEFDDAGLTKSRYTHIAPRSGYYNLHVINYVFTIVADSMWEVNRVSNVIRCVLDAVVHI